MTEKELLERGYKKKDLLLCDCGCGEYRNDQNCFATPNYVYIFGHQPKDATPFKDSRKVPK